MTPSPDRTEIGRAFDVLYPPGAVVEMRVPKTRTGTSSGYFDDRAKFIVAGASVNGHGPGVYVTINPVAPALLARACNRIRERADVTTSDRDAVRRCWILLDFDPIRAAGISATETEHQAALAAARIARTWLAELGVPGSSMVLADSGNGAHLLLHVDLPNDEPTTRLVQRCLDAVALHCGTPDVTVDRGVYNAARIVKLYGTVAMKGDATADRPHRRSQLLEIPAVLGVVPVAILERLAATLPTAEPRDTPPGRRDEQTFDVRAWLAAHGLGIRREKPWDKGATVLELTVCPFNPEHVGSAVVIVEASGRLLFRCLHNSCRDQRWPDVRDRFESDRPRQHSRQTKTDRKSAAAAAVDAEEVPPPTDDDLPPGQQRGPRRGGGDSQAATLVELAAGVELFHTPDPEAFATIQVAAHAETYPLKSQGFRLWLNRQFHEATGKVPSAEALQSAIQTLTGKAIFDGAEQPVFTRIGERERTVYIDCGNAHWMAIAYDVTGWRVLQEPPVKFRRPRGMLPLPMPVAGGSLVDLARFVNVWDEATWRVLLAWVLAALRPRGPYPILVLNGEQGSAKSTLTKVVRKLIDPNKVLLRRPPRDERDLMITATNSWIVSLDNLSYLSPWLSDSLCTLATGGGFGTRELYTDQEEILFEATRPIVVNGIVEFATRADFVDRALFLMLPEIADDQRRDEDGFWRDFDAAAPALLGALLDVMVLGLRRLSDVHLRRHPRMADFARWVTACEPALDWPADTFLRTYERRRRESATSVLEASPVAMAVLAFMATRTEWEGTVTELLEALAALVSETIRKDKKQWPRTPRGLRARLDRLLPEFRRVGWRLDFYQEGHDRTRKVCIRPSAPSASSAEAESQGNSADGCADGPQTDGPQPSATVRRPSADRPHASARNPRAADGADDADGSAGRRGGEDREPAADDGDEYEVPDEEESL
jgi:hypothetical protein